MKKLRLIAFLFSSLFLLTLVSCKDDAKDTEPTKQDLLTSGEWTGAKIYMSGKDVTQLYKTEQNYDMSKNILKFEKAGTYTDSYERSTISGKWEFSKDEQYIIHDKGTADESSFRIKALSAKQLIMTQEFSNQGYTSTFELEYKR
ncbi:hypothetical protein [Pontibacter arcticus]|uniref:Lipocalin-like domain-containing protein n=1 Tax=Pontibacter arcticus TaxID=2080288 RepID=A0A364RCB6_9BACT|nr:hypothetical protein [Pontibacter arcticus]RAU81895.1 hypothetical protein DP923_14505 [Pontibacter arcticus]